MKKLESDKRLDSISLDKTYYTEEGYLVDHPIVTTCGIFEYKNSDGSIRRELRLPEYVFEEKSLESYKGKPIIITHDAREVNKDNVRREQIGTIMSAGYRDGDSVRCEIIIHDTDALKRCGFKELSLGYSLDTDGTPGVWQGEKYDCIQKNIEINHLALVREARAGDTASLNIDGKEDDNNIFLKGGLVTMLTGNETGYRTDADAELTPEELEAAIALFKAQKAAEKVNVESTDGGDIIPDNDTGGDGEFEKKSPIEIVRENVDRRDAEGATMSPEDIIAQQKADIDTLLSEVDKLQASNDMGDVKVDGCGDNNDNVDESTKPQDVNEQEENKENKGINMDSLDKMVMERLDVCRMADKLNLDGIESLSVSEGKKRIIKAVNPKMNLDGKSDSYISAAYDIAKDTFSARKSTDIQRKKMVEDKIRNDAREASNSDTARRNMISKRIGGKK